MVWLWLSINSIVALMSPFAVFLMRTWIGERVRSIFAKEAAHLRSELQEREERLKSELRAREAEVTILTDRLLSGAATRQAAIAQRRLEAVEHVWEHVAFLRKCKGLAVTLGQLNLTAITKMAEKDQKLRDFIGQLLDAVPHDKIGDIGFKERLFVTDLAWAYFNAYSLIIVSNVAMARILKLGAKDAHKFLDYQASNLVLKETLPARAHYIEEHGFSCYHHLLDELEEKLRTELTNTLHGKEADEVETRRAARIIQGISDINNASERRKIEDSPAT